MTDYPYLTEVEPGPVQDALRILWDGLSELEGRLDGLAVASSLSDIRTALEVGGSHQLGVNGLLGQLLQPQPSFPRYSAVWYQVAASVAGAGEFQWDREVYHAAPDHFVRRNTSEIHFLRGGFYLVVANLECSAAGTLQLLLNGTRFAGASSVTVASLVLFLQLAVGTKLTATNTAGNRVGAADGRTNLAVVRLS